MGPRKLSARAYALTRAQRKLPGTSHVAVLKAINAGRLEGAFERRGPRRILRIDPDLADAAWVRNTDALESERSRTQAAPAPQAKAPAKRRAKRAKAKPQPAAELPEDSPTVEFPGASEPGAPGETGALYGHAALPEDLEQGEGDGEPALGTMARANAAKTAWQADLARLQVLERQGILVRADEVQSETVKIFRALRKQLEAISKRIDANLAASEDRGECRRMVEQEIALALSSVSAKCGAAAPVKAAG